MIEAVCLQANKLYRLWIARNSDFEKNGRVHLIGHSLGSALATHILSNQPTKMPNLSQLPKQVITKTRDRFLFNTSNFFMVGSPLGIFLHLDQTQLMPRKGRERTMQSPQDEAVSSWKY
jgi:pimeloyl-ACP methyl ester carboxylesterase